MDLHPDIYSMHELSEEVQDKLAFNEFFMLDYYPYGKKKIWEYWICGRINLTKILDDGYLNNAYNKSKEELIHNIKDEVLNAVYYLNILHPITEEKDMFNGQRKIAFMMSKIFTSGKICWNKDITKNKTVRQIESLIKKQTYRLRKVDRARGLPARERYPCYNQKYGVYCVEYYPLLPDLYTKKQIVAINLIVDCCFENLC